MKIISSLAVCAAIVGGYLLRLQMLSRSQRQAQQIRQSSPEVQVVFPVGRMQISTLKRPVRERFRDLKETEKVYKAGIGKKRLLIASHVAISRDGKMLAVAGKSDFTVRGRCLLLLLDARTGKRLRFIQNYQVQGLVFSPDGKWLITGGVKLRWWNVATGKLWREAQTRADSLAISADGEVLAVADYDSNRLDIWRTKPLHLQTRFGFMADPGRLAFSPDGRQVWSSTGLIYDVATDEMQRLSQSSYHGEFCKRGALSPDGFRLAQSEMAYVSHLPEESMIVSSTRSKRRVWYVPSSAFPAIEAAFSPDGKKVVLLRSPFYITKPPDSPVLAQLRDTESGQVLQTIRREHAADIGDAASAVFLPDGKTLILAGTGLDNAIKIVHLTTK